MILNRFLKKRLIGKIIKGIGTTIAQDIKITSSDQLKIGCYSHIGIGMVIHGLGKVEFGNNVITGPNITFYTMNHNYLNAVLLPYDNNVLIKKTVIEDNVWIGGNVIILPGIKIGEGAVIAAGTVVSKDVPSLAVVAGNPYSIVKHRDRSVYEQLKNEEKIYLKYKELIGVNYIEE